MKGLILPSVSFLAGAICKQEYQPGVLQVVWVSDSAVPLHGCLCCFTSALCWSPLLCLFCSPQPAWSSALQTSGWASAGKVPGGFADCTTLQHPPPTPGEIMHWYFRLVLLTHEMILNNAISLWIKNEICCLSSSKRRCFHNWLRRNWSVIQLLLLLCTELIICVKIGCLTAVDHSFTLYRYLELLVWYYFNLGHYWDAHSNLFSSLP